MAGLATPEIFRCRDFSSTPPCRRDNGTATCRFKGSDHDRAFKAEKEARQADDPAAGDRQVNRPRHRSGALSQPGA